MANRTFQIAIELLYSKFIVKNSQFNTFNDIWIFQNSPYDFPEPLILQLETSPNVCKTMHRLYTPTIIQFLHSRYNYLKFNSKPYSCGQSVRITLECVTRCGWGGFTHILIKLNQETLNFQHFKMHMLREYLHPDTNL